MFELFKKFISGLLVASLAFGIVDAHAFSEHGKQAFLSAYGKVDEVWTNPKPAPHVYFIQDAHDSVEAQKNIARIIHELTLKTSVKKVFEEGCEGLVPVDQYFGSVKPDLKKRAANYYLKNLLINGPEYARIFSKEPFDLIGVENSELYLKNIKTYQIASRYRYLVLNEISELKLGIKNEIFKKANPNQKKIIQSWASQESHEITILQYAQILINLLRRHREDPQRGDVAISIYKNKIASPLARNDSMGKVFGAVIRLENLFAGKLKKVPHANQILADLDEIQTIAENQFFEGDLKEGWEYFKALTLLERLSRLEMNPEEVNLAREILENGLTEKAARWIGSERNGSVAFSKAWEILLQASLVFYQTAAARDQVVIKKLKQLKPGENAALVFGGFHREHLTKLMRTAGISYTVITPQISAIQADEQIQYRKLMLTPIVPLSMTSAAANRNIGNFFAVRSELRLPQKDPYRIFSRSELRAIDPKIDVQLERLAGEIAAIIIKQLERGGVVIFDGASGIGKTTLIKKVLEKIENKKPALLTGDVFLKSPAKRKLLESQIVARGKKYVHEPQDFWRNGLRVKVLEAALAILASGVSGASFQAVLNYGYDRHLQKMHAMKALSRKLFSGGILIVDDKYGMKDIPEIAQAKGVSMLSFRLIGNRKKTKMQFEARTLAIAAARNKRQSFVERRKQFYDLGLAPSWEAHAKKTASKIDYHIDVSADNPKNWKVQVARSEARDPLIRLRRMKGVTSILAEKENAGTRVDVLNENGRRTGETKTKFEIHKSGDWHAVSTVLLTYRGRSIWLRMKRSKNLYKNQFQFAVHGHVDAGEAVIQAASREGLEEVNIKLVQKKLKKIKQYKEVMTHPQGINREIVTVYSYDLSDAEFNKFNPDARESSEALFLPAEIFGKTLKKNPDIFTSRVRNFFETSEGQAFLRRLKSVRSAPPLLRRSEGRMPAGQAKISTDLKSQTETHSGIFKEAKELWRAWLPWPDAQLTLLVLSVFPKTIRHEIGRVLIVFQKKLLARHGSDELTKHRSHGSIPARDVASEVRSELRLLTQDLKQVEPKRLKPFVNIQFMHLEQQRLDALLGGKKNRISDDAWQVLNNPHTAVWNKTLNAKILAEIISYFKNSKEQKADTYRIVGNLLHWAAFNNIKAKHKKFEPALARIFPSPRLKGIKTPGRKVTSEYNRAVYKFKAEILKDENRDLAAVFIEMVDFLLDVEIQEFKYRAYLSNETAGMGDSNEFALMPDYWFFYHDIGSELVNKGVLTLEKFKTMRDRANRARFYYDKVRTLLPVYFISASEEQLNRLLARLNAETQPYQIIRKIHGLLSASRSQDLLYPENHLAEKAQSFWDRFRAAQIELHGKKSAGGNGSTSRSEARVVQWPEKPEMKGHLLTDSRGFLGFLSRLLQILELMDDQKKIKVEEVLGTIVGKTFGDWLGAHAAVNLITTVIGVIDLMQAENVGDYEELKKEHSGSEPFEDYLVAKVEKIRHLVEDVLDKFFIAIEQNKHLIPERREILEKFFMENLPVPQAMLLPYFALHIIDYNGNRELVREVSSRMRGQTETGEAFWAQMRKLMKKFGRFMPRIKETGINKVFALAMYEDSPTLRSFDWAGKAGMQDVIQWVDLNRGKIIGDELQFEERNDDLEMLVTALWLNGKLAGRSHEEWMQAVMLYKSLRSEMRLGQMELADWFRHLFSRPEKVAREQRIMNFQIEEVLNSLHLPDLAVIDLVGPRSPFTTENHMLVWEPWLKAMLQRGWQVRVYESNNKYVELWNKAVKKQERHRSKIIFSGARRYQTAKGSEIADAVVMLSVLSHADIPKEIRKQIAATAARRLKRGGKWVVGEYHHAHFGESQKFSEAEQARTDEILKSVETGFKSPSERIRTGKHTVQTLTKRGRSEIRDYATIEKKMSEWIDAAHAYLNDPEPKSVPRPSEIVFDGYSDLATDLNSPPSVRKLMRVISEARPRIFTNGAKSVSLPVTDDVEPGDTNDLQPMREHRSGLFPPVENSDLLALVERYQHALAFKEDVKRAKGKLSLNLEFDEVQTWIIQSQSGWKVSDSLRESFKQLEELHEKFDNLRTRLEKSILANISGLIPKIRTAITDQELQVAQTLMDEAMVFMDSVREIGFMNFEKQGELRNLSKELASLNDELKEFVRLSIKNVGAIPNITAPRSVPYSPAAALSPEQIEYARKMLNVLLFDLKIANSETTTAQLELTLDLPKGFLKEFADLREKNSAAYHGYIIFLERKIAEWLARRNPDLARAVDYVRFGFRKETTVEQYHDLITQLLFNREANQFNAEPENLLRLAHYFFHLADQYKDEQRTMAALAEQLLMRIPQEAWLEESLSMILRRSPYEDRHLSPVAQKILRWLQTHEIHLMKLRVAPIDAATDKPKSVTSSDGEEGEEAFESEQEEKEIDIEAKSEAFNAAIENWLKTDNPRHEDLIAILDAYDSRIDGLLGDEMIESMTWLTQVRDMQEVIKELRKTSAGKSADEMQLLPDYPRIQRVRLLHDNLAALIVSGDDDIDSVYKKRAQHLYNALDERFAELVSQRRDDLVEIGLVPRYRIKLWNQILEMTLRFPGPKTLRAFAIFFKNTWSSTKGIKEKRTHFIAWSQLYHNADGLRLVFDRAPRVLQDARLLKELDLAQAEWRAAILKNQEVKTAKHKTQAGELKDGGAVQAEPPAAPLQQSPKSETDDLLKSESAPKTSQPDQDVVVLDSTKSQREKVIHSVQRQTIDAGTRKTELAVAVEPAEFELARSRENTLIGPKLGFFRKGILTLSHRELAEQLSHGDFQIDEIGLKTAEKRTTNRPPKVILQSIILKAEQLVWKTVKSELPESSQLNDAKHFFSSDGQKLLVLKGNQGRVFALNEALGAIYFRFETDILPENIRLFDGDQIFFEHGKKIHALNLVLPAFKSSVVEPLSPDSTRAVIRNAIPPFLDEPIIVLTENVARLLHTKYYPLLVGSRPGAYIRIPDASELINKEWGFFQGGLRLTSGKSVNEVAGGQVYLENNANHLKKVSLDIVHGWDGLIHYYVRYEKTEEGRQKRFGNMGTAHLVENPQKKFFGTMRNYLAMLIREAETKSDLGEEVLLEIEDANELITDSHSLSYGFPVFGDEVYGVYRGRVQFDGRDALARPKTAINGPPTSFLIRSISKGVSKFEFTSETSSGKKTNIFIRDQSLDYFGGIRSWLKKQSQSPTGDDVPISADRSELRSSGSVEMAARVSVAMQTIKKNKLPIEILMEAEDFAALSQSEFLELHKILAWDKNIRFKVFRAMNLHGEAAEQFHGLQNEFTFKRVTGEETQMSAPKRRQTTLQLTKNPELLPQPGVHTFLYEDMEGFVPAALLYSLENKAALKLLRFSKMGERWSWFGAHFFDFFVYQSFAVAA